MATELTFTAVVHQADGWFVARCLEVEVTSQGRSEEEALANLREGSGALLGGRTGPARHL